ncbi:uncharacterized protein LOC143179109 [Calliopsis andreniformis]|uniref:uncharacterized protein LOC143179109 n=1 Tax=Calliopsis andreniformis TaxID=337506 RepID=UPI003FCE0690
MLHSDCLEFDVVEVEDYLSKLDLGNVSMIDMIIGQFKCPVTTLPLGALKSDWDRLLLLQKSQPAESILRKKLGRLFRILMVAYFQMEEHFNVTKSGLQSRDSVNTSFTYETTVTIHMEKETEKIGTLTAEEKDTSKTFESSTSSIVSGQTESIDTNEIERTMMDWDVTGERGDNSNRIHNQVSSTTGVSLPVDSNEQIEVGVTEAVITFSNDITFDITVPPNLTPRKDYTEMFDNYLHNNAIAEDFSQLNEHVAMQTKDERKIFLQKEMQSTTEYLIEDGSSTSSPLKESTIDRQKTNERNINVFMGKKSGVNDVVIEGNTIKSVDRIESATLPILKSDTLITRLNSSNSSSTSTISDILQTDFTEYQIPPFQDAIGEKINAATSIPDTHGTSIEITENKIKRPDGRGDSPIFDVSANTEEEEKDMIGERGGSEFSMMQYLDSIDSDLMESENTTSSKISDVKSPTKSNHFDTDRISENDVTGSTESFVRNRSNHGKGIFEVFKKAPWNLQNSTSYRNKIRKPSVSEKPPVDNEFWKYIVISQNVTLAAPTTLKLSWKLSDRMKTNTIAEGDFHY